MESVEKATKYATEVPLDIMKTAYESMALMQAMALKGMQASLSDTAVAVLCAKTAVAGAYLNVRINAKEIKDVNYSKNILKQAKTIFEKSNQIEKEIMAYIDSKL